MTEHNFFSPCLFSVLKVFFVFLVFTHLRHGRRRSEVMSPPNGKLIQPLLSQVRQMLRSQGHRHPRRTAGLSEPWTAAALTSERLANLTQERSAGLWEPTVLTSQRPANIERAVTGELEITAAGRHEFGAAPSMPQVGENQENKKNLLKWKTNMEKKKRRRSLSVWVCCSVTIFMRGARRRGDVE